MSDIHHPDHPDYGNAPTAADFCRGCGEERGCDMTLRKGLCPGCIVRRDVLGVTTDDDMTDEDRAWLDAVEAGQ